MFSRHYASLERSSIHTLGTIPRFRSRSRETIRRYNTDKDGERLKKMKRKLSNISTTKAATYDNAYHDRRRQKVTEDLIWEKLNEEGLGKYINLLKDEEVDKGTFLALTNNDLIDIGIIDVTHRNALLRIAKSLRS
ncbi:Protein bicaudal [Dirofilaria immitis]